MLQQERRTSKAGTIQLLPASELARAATIWQDLEQRLGGEGLTNSWSWIETWLAYYGHIQHGFAFGYRGEDHRAYGAALITLAPGKVGPCPIRTAHLGTAGEAAEETTAVQYNCLLVAPIDLDDFAAGLICLLKELRWSQFWLDGFVSDHADALITAAANAGLQFQVEDRRCLAFNFRRAADAGHTDIVSALGSDTRYNVRRSMRLFEGHLGPRTVEWATDREHAHDILRELISLHQERWKRAGQAGAFQSTRVRRYHEALINELLPKGAIMAFRVKHGATTIGCLINFVRGSHVLSYKSGLVHFPDDNRMKPGLVTHVLCMEECKSHGFSDYDFLAGVVPYKQQLSNTEYRLVRAVAQRGPWMWVLMVARKVYYAIESFHQAPTTATAQDATVIPFPARKVTRDAAEDGTWNQ